MWSPSDIYEMPFGDWVDFAVKDWLVPNFRPVFQSIRIPVEWVLDGLDGFLNFVPMVVFTVVLVAIAWRAAGRGLAIFSIVSLIFLDLIGVWSETMTTLAMVTTAVFFCALFGVPLGVMAARSDRFLKVLRPVLDVMQTIPPFVYLVPIVMLFGVGTVPGVIATFIFALPPITRLTNLGIRSVREDLVEASYAFGSTPRQVLWEVQIPLAMRTIMAGLNQTLMMSLSMAVIAALIGAGGLGLTVNTGLGRLDVGLATEGGIGIVILAIILDRITQSFAERRSSTSPSLTGILRSLFSSGKPARPAADKQAA
ncbi:glycine betaine/proline transport system permease protein [Tranquillimonas rosea]|uniref:Glycine betaine/proline transport system permease protein n=1 Tax=Tranquillimonas rosea TaxID=641238 RepID=A0A1H9UUF9_9RHOB|nr:proline/glycine betaine ABC transporter permease [Tranquillimonas rosea]SES13170.1 glycine betaine/proline transport system permease protein [Tranquillimonas rosea]